MSAVDISGNDIVEGECTGVRHVTELALAFKWAERKVAFICEASPAEQKNHKNTKKSHPFPIKSRRLGKISSRQPPKANSSQLSFPSLCVYFRLNIAETVTLPFGNIVKLKSICYYF